MDNERPANFSLEDGYLRVAGACGRAEYLERLAHDHALGKLRVSGLPNGTGERRDIPLLGLIDYRLAFGTDGRGTLAVHKNLAAKWLPGDGLTISKTRASKWPLFAPRNPSSDWRTPPPRSTPASEPGRRLLAEGDTEIDQRAYRAIMRACARAKPGAAPAAFTDLQLSGKEFIKLFHKGAGKAPADARVLTAAAAREILRKAIAEKNRNEAGKAFSQRLAVTHVQSIDPQFDREEVRKIMRELTESVARAPQINRRKIIGAKVEPRPFAHFDKLEFLSTLLNRSRALLRKYFWSGSCPSCLLRSF